MLFNDVIREYQQVQSSHDNDEREDEILSEDAMKSNANFGETRDTETLEEIVSDLLITDAENQNLSCELMITVRVQTILVYLLKINEK